MAKRSGLLQRKAAEEARLRAGVMEAAKFVRQQTADDLLKMMVIALNEELGLGNERLRRVAERLYKVTEEFDKLAGEEEDFDYARDVMNRRLVQIFGDVPAEFRLRY